MDNKPRKSIFNLSNQDDTNQQPDDQESTKQVTIGDRGTTLVGKGVEQKIPEQPQEDNRVPEETLFQWEAPEFVLTQKPFGWYMGIFGFFILLGLLIVWLQQWSSSGNIIPGLPTIGQWITLAVFIFVSIVLSVWANRRPKILNYQITNYGVIVENKHYNFDDFREFYEYVDYNQGSLDLVPAKRLGTLVSIPLATEDADSIKKLISHMVPLVEHQEDIVDKIFRRLRF